MTHAEITAQHGDAPREVAVDPEVRPGGHGETRAEVADRVVRCLTATLATVPDGATAVFVTTAVRPGLRSVNSWACHRRIGNA